jgi:hypothetical protein
MAYSSIFQAAVGHVHMLLDGQIANEAACRQDEEVIIEGKPTKSLPPTEQTQEQEEAWYNGADIPRDLSK